jgi:hydrogenase-4 membrane subunit HyfE
MKRYLISIGILTVILTAISVLKAYLPFTIHPTYNSMLVFYTIQSVVVAVILYFAEGKKENYGLFALGIVVLRLITALIFLMIMYVRGTEDTMVFAVQFMLLYLSYLVFELTVVLSNLRRN